MYKHQVNSKRGSGYRSANTDPSVLSATDETNTALDIVGSVSYLWAKLAVKMLLRLFSSIYLPHSICHLPPLATC
jgi:hypothetical protein